jgi:hypothetical protein
LEVSGANFFLEVESFQALGALSQAKSATAIRSNRTTASVMMQARGCRAGSLKLSNDASEKRRYYQAHVEEAICF